jgi:VWFA-related protein
MRVFLPLSSIQKFALLCLVFGPGAVAAFAQSPAPSPPAQQPAPEQSSPSAPAATPANSPATPPAVPPAADEQRPKDEVTTSDTPATFKVHVNLVQVRVVVRDASGKIIPDLHREDFQIFDNRKPQLLSTFNVDTPESRAAALVLVDSAPGNTPDVEKAAAAVKLPQRFVAMVFDDVHLSMEDALFVRVEAAKFFDSLTPTDRVGIYSSSGETTQEFTDDRAVLRKTLMGIVPHSSTIGFHDCPDVSYYEADQIQNIRDPQAIAVATEDTVQCAFGGDESKAAQALSIALNAAQHSLAVNDADSSYTYSHLREITRRLSGMPGQRIMVFISPGFIRSTLWTELNDLVDHALQGKITINTIDARGLYTPDVGGDIADPPRSSFRTTGFQTSYRIQAQFAQSEVLMDMALGTGGTFFHNRNDLDEGMRQAGAVPEVSYVLGFSPQNLKFDGKFHEIKVTLANKRKGTVQARRGYYAPRTLPDPAAAAKADIQEAIFSQDEIHDLPVDLQTQFFKIDPTDARIAVLTHFDLKGVHFRKADGRSNDTLTFATAIFDQNGNFVTGNEKVLDMKLKDTTYEKLSHSGMNVKSTFDVKPGTYMVRLVVRDSEGAQMAARNGAVVIPF